MLGHCVFLWAGAASAQICVGDLDADRRITENDLSLLENELFRVEPGEPLNVAGDMNLDGAVTVADVLALVTRMGWTCPITGTPTRKPSLTPSGTPTATPTRTPPPRSPTATRTPTVSPTPTQVCPIRKLDVGTTIDGELTAGDCERMVNGEQRFVDVYEITGTIGRAVKVQIVATGGPPTLEPYATVIDGNGQFGQADGLPPLEWVVSTAAPYQLIVSSRPGTSTVRGTYRITTTTRPCPTPKAINLNTGFSVSNLKLDEFSCPDPGSVSTLNYSNPTDLYTFDVTSVPTQVDITMRQIREDDAIDPTFSLLGPDGIEVLNSDQVDDLVGGLYGSDAGARFLALQTGTYRLLAQGGFGRYSLVVRSPSCTARKLENIPSDRPLTCSGQAGSGCAGTFFGDRRKGTCGAPLPLVGLDDLPDPSAGADLYTFQAQAGDVVSVQLRVPSDDAYLYLLGPASAGNPLVAYDNDSGPVSPESDAQLAATLPVAGTYTVIVANTSSLIPPDPSFPGDTGDEIAYTMYIQKCHTSGNLDPSSGRVVNGSFSMSDCTGFGGIPFRSYVINGTAGQFITAQMSSRTGEIDPYLRLLGPDGSVTSNDGDPFDSDRSDARISRVLPVTGMYFLEVSTWLEAGAVDVASNPSFTLGVSTCATRGVAPGRVDVTLDTSDCSLPNGRRYEVLTLAGDTTPRVLSVRPGADSCVVALLGNGTQFPDYGSCANGNLDIPMPEPGTYALVVAGAPGKSGRIPLDLARCPLARLRYGDNERGALSQMSCVGADGQPSAWYLLRDTAPLVRFNDGIGGIYSMKMAGSAFLTDLAGSAPISGGYFSSDWMTMFPFRVDLAALLRVAGSPGDPFGEYEIHVDSAYYRQ